MSGATEAQHVCPSGLSRSYSEHADLVLRHYRYHNDNRHDRRHEPPSYTQSGPNFRANDYHCREAEDIANENEADDEEEEEDDEAMGINRGQRTWRTKRVARDETREFRDRGCKIGAGDSYDLSVDFSQLNLDQRQQRRNPYGDDFASSMKSFNAYHDDYNDACDEPFSFVDDDDNENFKMIVNNRGYENDDELARPMSDNDANEDRPIVEANDTDDQQQQQRVTTTSSNNNKKRLNGQPLERMISYDDWTRETQLKQQRRRDEARRDEIKKREIENIKRLEREDKERRDMVAFMEWTRRKEMEKLKKKTLLEKEIERQRILWVTEKNNGITKDERLREWWMEKEENMKALARLARDESIKKKNNEEKKKQRLQESIKAYEKWREGARHIPKPATQGILPHQTAKPKFTNPNPWVPLVDETIDDDADNGTRKINSSTSASSVKNKRTGIAKRARVIKD